MGFPKTLKAIAVLSGTIIGAGMFALPFITLKVGILVMFLYLFVLGLISAKIHLMFGEVSFKTPDFLRFPSFAKIHLGGFAQKVAYITGIFGLIGSLLAYLIIGGAFMKGLLGHWFDFDFHTYVLFFGILSSWTILKGIDLIEKISLWCLFFFFASLALIFFFAYPTMNFSYLNFIPENINWFLPYGAVLFSFGGLSVIPEIEEMFLSKKERKEKPINAKKAFNNVVLWSFLIAFAIYSFFIFLVLGVCGFKTTEMSLDCFVETLGPGMGAVALAFGFVVILTSFMTVGLTLKKIFHYDMKLPQGVSWTLSSFAPMLLYFSGAQNFLTVISFIGGVFMGAEGILVMLMHKKIFPKDNFSVIFSLIFLAGVIYEIVNFFFKW